MATYVIFNNVVTDAQKMAKYVGRAFELIEASGGEVLVFDEESTILEGDSGLPRTIVLRFNSRDEAEAWYHSPAYREILPLRLEATVGTARIVDDYSAATV